MLLAVRRSLVELLESRLHLARPEPGLSEDVRFRLPLATDTSAHYYFDRDVTAGAVAWNGTGQTYDGHKGTDFSGGPRGKPVYAAADGILIAKVDGLPDGDDSTVGNGNYVRLNHGNDRNGNPINSVYLHFNAGTVTTKPIGSLIRAGEQIGGVGTSGHSTGLHLHFETQVARAAFDPYKATGSAEASWWVNQGTGSPGTTANDPKLHAGDAVQVYDLPGGTLAVRGPNAAGTSVGAEANGAAGTVLDGPTYAAFGNDNDNSLWVWYRVAWANGLTGWSTQNWLRPRPDTVAPAVVATAFAYDATPHKFNVDFTEDVGASLSASDFVVTRTGTSTPVTFTLGYDAAAKRATLDFGGVLPDGRYHVGIAAAGVTDASGNPLAADASADFFSLAGDVDRDGSVGFSDLLVVAQHYGQSGQPFGNGNVTYDAAGLVNFADLLLLAQHYDVVLSSENTVGLKRRKMIETLSV